MRDTFSARISGMGYAGSVSASEHPDRSLYDIIKGRNVVREDERVVGYSFKFPDEDLSSATTSRLTAYISKISDIEDAIGEESFGQGYHKIRSVQLDGVGFAEILSCFKSFNVMITESNLSLDGEEYEVVD